MILADDGPRIIDFGIARAAEASPMTTAGVVVGTYSYMAPEQLRGELARPASDVFALGCTLAFAATARVTFGEDSIVTVMYRITTEPPDLTDLPDEHGFRELISACLAKSPDDRPSLATILTALARTGTAAAVADPAASGPGPVTGSAPQYEPTRTMRTGDTVLATGDSNGRTYLWNVATGKLVHTFRDPASHGLYDVTFSPDGDYVATSDRRRRLRVEHGLAELPSARGDSQRANSVARDSRTTVMRIWPG